MTANSKENIKDVEDVEDFFNELKQRCNISNKRKSGVVKWFDDEKGYGFISSKDVVEDIFVHFTAIKMKGHKNLSQGQIVSFILKETNDNGPRAEDVKISLI